MITMTPKTLVLELHNALDAQIVPFIHGSPGIGKSDIIRQLAKARNLKVIDFRVSQCGPEDLNGLPFRTEDGRSTWLPPKDIPLEGDPVPEGYAGWLLFFDEANQGSIETQKAMFKLILDRLVGQHKVHPKVWMIAAGNKDTDGAIVNRMPTPLASRFVHFELEPNFDAWEEWANENGIDSRITAFLTFRKELFWKFDPKAAERTFCCPRTWEFVSRLIHKQESPRLATVAAAVGEGPGAELCAFVDSFDKLPSLSDIVADPEGTPIPEELSVIYALCSLMISSERITPENAGSIVRYVERLGLEYQFFILRAWFKRRTDLLTNPSILEWVGKYTDEMYG